MLEREWLGFHAAATHPETGNQVTEEIIIMLTLVWRSQAIQAGGKRPLLPKELSDLPRNSPWAFRFLAKHSSPKPLPNEKSEPCSESAAHSQDKTWKLLVTDFEK